MLEKENIRQVVIACEYPLSDSKIVHDSISLWILLPRFVWGNCSKRSILEWINDYIWGATFDV
jgi:hypothetical protein